MSLNNIQLPGFLIEEWYSDKLIVSPAATSTLPAKGTRSPAPFKSLGNNRRHITILVHAPGSPFLPDNQLAFLTKILEACRMTLADVAIVNNAAHPVTIPEFVPNWTQRPSFYSASNLQPSACRSIFRRSNPSTMMDAPFSPHPALTNSSRAPKKASC